jgi:hypothetical protein
MARGGPRKRSSADVGQIGQRTVSGASIGPVAAVPLRGGGPAPMSGDVADIAVALARRRGWAVFPLNRNKMPGTRTA